jgi:broad specificity phosphatase PhoE
MRVYLIRHGQTEWNAKDLALGQSDIDLSEKGKAQLERLRERFEDVKIDRIISSDLLRCRRTSAAVAGDKGAPIEYLPALRERSFGSWEGKENSVVNAQLFEMAKNNGLPLYDAKAPDGESHRDVWDRVEPVLFPYLQEDLQLVIVTHGGTSRVILSILLKGTLETTFGFRVEHSAVSQIDRRPDGPFILNVYNDCSHLTGLI